MKRLLMALIGYSLMTGCNSVPTSAPTHVSYTHALLEARQPRAAALGPTIPASTYQSLYGALGGK